MECTEDTESKLTSAATVFNGTLPSGKPARSRTDEAPLRTSQALWCITYPMAIPGWPGGQDVGGKVVCHDMLQPHVLRGDLRTSGTYMDNLQACVALTKPAAGALGSANSAGLPKAAQAALPDLRGSTNKVAQALETCKPPTPTAVVPQPIGGVCAAAAGYATRTCEGGAASCRGSLLGQCDAVRHCGPGLECRAGECQLPCTCPPDCLVSSQGSCQRTVPQSNTVRKSCNLAMGQCPFPCFKDESKNCKIDKIETATKQENSALVCLWRSIRTCRRLIGSDQLNSAGSRAVRTMSFVFVSHAGTDRRTHVRPVVQALAIEGVSLWPDRPGSSVALRRASHRAVPATPCDTTYRLGIPRRPMPCASCRPAWLLSAGVGCLRTPGFRGARGAQGLRCSIGTCPLPLFRDGQAQCKVDVPEFTTR